MKVLNLLNVKYLIDNENEVKANMKSDKNFSRKWLLVMRFLYQIMFKSKLIDICLQFQNNEKIKNVMNY